MGAMPGRGAPPPPGKGRAPSRRCGARRMPVGGGAPGRPPRARPPPIRSVAPAQSAPPITPMHSAHHGGGWVPRGRRAEGAGGRKDGLRVLTVGSAGGRTSLARPSPTARAALRGWRDGRGQARRLSLGRVGCRGSGSNSSAQGVRTARGGGFLRAVSRVQAEWCAALALLPPSLRPGSLWASPHTLSPFPLPSAWEAAGTCLLCVTHTLLLYFSFTSPPCRPPPGAGPTPPPPARPAPEPAAARPKKRPDRICKTSGKLARRESPMNRRVARRLSAVGLFGHRQDLPGIGGQNCRAGASARRHHRRTQK